MCEQHILATNAEEHLETNPELRHDIMELHRIGDVPMYRGAPPGSFRVRGLPRNPDEQDYIMENSGPMSNKEKCLRAREGAPQMVISSWCLHLPPWPRPFPTGPFPLKKKGHMGWSACKPQMS